MSAEFFYALINRPLAVGTAPPGVQRLEPRPGPADPLHAWARHGLVVYAHPLAAAEVRRFELGTVITADAEAALLARLTATYRGEATALLATAAEDADGFRRAVLHAVDQGFDGYRALLRDPEGFCARLRAALATASGDPG